MPHNIYRDIFRQCVVAMYTPLQIKYRTRKKCLQRCKYMCYIIVFIFFYLVINSTCRKHGIYTPEIPPEMTNRNFDKYVRKFQHSTWKQADVKKILVWTPFFRDWGWIEGLRREFQRCSAACAVTKDKSELDSSDAVLFHVTDLWHYKGLIGTAYTRNIKMPARRQQHQVWATVSFEPVVHFWGELPPDTFNWTIFHRRDATIHAPFYHSESFNKHMIEDQRQTPRRNYFKDKTKFSSILVSNCKDQARRYRILRELNKYIDIDDFGQCSGRILCPAGVPTSDCGAKYLSHYKFYLAFENSFCRDYVSEKFWNALDRRQIPVIAAPQYNTELLPKGSYLNVFDFPSIKDLAERMIEVGSNETLYNSFFDWIDSYKAETDTWQCQLCTALHTNMTPQSYSDMEAWVRDDMCYKNTVTSMLAGFVDRLLFDLGLS